LIIERGKPFREEINFIDNTGRPVFDKDYEIYIYLEYGLDVQKVKLPFNGIKAVLEISQTHTYDIKYNKLYYKIVAVREREETILNTGIIEVI